MEEWKIYEKQLKILDDLTICPVCNQRMTGVRAAVSCVNGHAVCSPCKEKLSACPTCRDPFPSQGQPTLLRQLLEALPQRCENEGCNRVVEDDHSKWCDFRYVYCFKCKCKYAVNTYADHYTVTHPEKFVEGGVKQFSVVCSDVYNETLLFSVTNGTHLFLVNVLPRPKENKVSLNFHHIARENMYMHNGVTYKASVGFLMNEADSEPALDMTTIIDLKNYPVKNLSVHNSTLSDLNLLEKGKLHLKISIFENAQK